MKARGKDSTQWAVLQDLTQRAHPKGQEGNNPFKDKMLAAKAILTEVGSGQHKSYFLPFFLSHVLLDHNKKTHLHFPHSWDLLKDESVQKVPYWAASTYYLSILSYISKLLIWTKNPQQMSSGKDLAFTKRELYCKLGKLCLLLAERDSTSARSVFLGRN